MTEWQWRVVMALVRYVLANAGHTFPGKNEHWLGEEDRDILIEAAVQDRT